MFDFLVENDFLSAVIAFGIVLIPIIIIHELGHFFAAKAAGITVIEFGIGFPPKAMRLFMWGETEFTLNWLPLGGFVRPLGEDLIGPVSEEKLKKDREAVRELMPEQESEARSSQYLSEREEMMARGIAEADLKSVNDVAPIPRIIFMAAGALANFASAIVIFIIVALIGLPEITGALFQFVSIPQGSVFQQAGIREGDIIEMINGQTFQSVDEFVLELNSTEDDAVTLTMNNPETDETYDVEIPASDLVFSGYVMVLGIQPGSPAEDAGLQVDDEILAVNGEDFATDTDPIPQLQQAANDFAGEEVTLTILRDGETQDVTLVPRANVTPEQGRIGIGIQAIYGLGEEVRLVEGVQQELIPQSLPDAINHGFSQTFETFGLIIEIPVRLLQGTISAQEARPVSIVTISQIGGKFLQSSVEEGQPVDLLNFVALVSIFVGATNLLPLPALDGGRILFVLIEIIRGKPVAPEREGFIHTMGFVFLLSLGVIIIIYDIVNPFVLPQ